MLLLGCRDTLVSDEKHDLGLPDGYEQRFHDGLRYGLFVPPSYDPSEKYPLIVSLHGSMDTTSWDLMWYHEPIQLTDPVIVLTPKSLIPGNGWGTSWATMFSSDMRKTMEVVSDLRQTYSIDSDRLYVYGTSMGGFGVLSALALEPGLFAGAFSICGGGYAQTAPEVSQTPLWMFHGSLDPIVPLWQSKDLYEAMVAAGARQVRFTEYPEVGHEAWIPAWKEPTLTTWLLAQNRGATHGPPDPPENVRVEVGSSGEVTVRWNPPSDLEKADNAVWLYRITFRGQEIGEVDNTHLTFSPAGAPGASPEEYGVAAVNFWFEQSAIVSASAGMIAETVSP